MKRENTLFSAAADGQRLDTLRGKMQRPGGENGGKIAEKRKILAIFDGFRLFFPGNLTRSGSSRGIRVGSRRV
jgi:hypothetical protein